jgi:hypothetical protein
VRVRSRSSVARAPPVGRAYLQDRSGRERTGAVLLSAARAPSVATAVHCRYARTRLRQVQEEDNQPIAALRPLSAEAKAKIVQEENERAVEGAMLFGIKKFRAPSCA